MRKTILPFFLLIIAHIEIFSQCNSIMFGVKNPNITHSPTDVTIETSVGAIVPPPCYFGDFVFNGPVINDKFHYYINNLAGVIATSNASANYAKIYAHYHMNKCYEYLTNLGFNISIAPPGISFGIDGSVDAIELSGSSILFQNENFQTDVFGPSSGVSMYLLNVLNSNMVNTNHGILLGTQDYLAQSYKRSLGGTSATHECFTQPNISIDRVTNYTGCYGNMASLENNAQIWSSVLTKIEEGIGAGKTMKILLTTFAGFSSSTTQKEAAKEYLQNAVNNATSIGLSGEDLCLIKGIIRNHYWCVEDDEYRPDLTFYKDGQPDYWIRNNGADGSGVEPAWGGNLWESPDIVNTINGVETMPVYGANNVLKVTIKNIGTGNCEKLFLRLYYSYNLTSQIWPDDWTTPPYSKYIGEVPIPDIDPQMMKDVTMSWSPPSPGNEQELHTCIYARVVSDDGHSYSLNHNENEYTFAWSTGWNVAYFNGIAWRNMVVKKKGLIPYPGDSMAALENGLLLFVKGNEGTGDPDGPYPDAVVGPNTIDFQINPDPVNPGIGNGDPTFFDEVDVYLRPEGDLAEIISNTPNALIEGSYALSETGYYRILNENFAFKNLKLNSGQMYRLRVKSIPKTRFNNASFSIIQRNYDGLIFGGETYVMFAERNQKNAEIRQIEGNINSKIIIAPNPASNQVEIFASSENGDIKSLALYDKNGRLVRIEQGVEKIYIYTWDTSTLEKGVYTIEVIYSSDRKESTQLIKIE